MTERFTFAPDRDIEVDRPLLVLGLEGWFDSGFGAAGAVAGLMATIEARTIVRFDADTYIDHRARRPLLRIVDGRLTSLTWPNIRLRHGRDRSGHDVLVLCGPEPDMHWHDFADDVVGLAQRFDVRVGIAFGAYPSAAPHTRPIRIIAAGKDEELVRQVGFVPGTIDVPAGAQSMLEIALADAGIPTVGLWAQVPHYLSATPFPPASAALLDELTSVAGLDLDLDEIHGADTVARQRIDELIANSDEHRELVGQLEAQYDEMASSNPIRTSQLPTGDEIAAELERFLRGEAG